MRNIMLLLMIGTIFFVGCGPEKSAIERAQEQEDANEKYKDDKEEAREKIKVERRKKELATVEGFYHGYLQAEAQLAVDGPCRSSDLFEEVEVPKSCFPVMLEIELTSDFTPGADNKLKEVPKLKGQLILFGSKEGYQKGERFYVFNFSTGDFDAEIKTLLLTGGRGDSGGGPIDSGNYSISGTPQLPYLNAQFSSVRKKNLLYLERR